MSMRTFLAALATVFVVVVLATLAHDGWQKAADERRLRIHACHELVLAGADADSAADVEACTFEATR